MKMNHLQNEKRKFVLADIYSDGTTATAALSANFLFAVLVFKSRQDNSVDQ